MIYKFMVSIVAVVVCMLFYDISYAVYSDFNSITEQGVGYILFYFVFMYLPIYIMYQFKKVKVMSMLLSIATVIYIHISIGDLFPYKHMLIILCFFVGLLFIESLNRLKRLYIIKCGN